MSKAGFWAIDPTRKLSFAIDGRWYADNEPIRNDRINLLFSQRLERTPEGSYRVTIGPDSVLVEIDDTPYVVTSVTEDRTGRLILRLNDASEEALDPASLTLGDANVLYCRVKSGQHPARFLRPAYYQLADYIQQDVDGQFVLRVRASSHRLALGINPAD